MPKMPTENGRLDMKQLMLPGLVLSGDRSSDAGLSSPQGSNMQSNHTWSADIVDRVRPLNEVAIAPPASKKYVLCWLQQTVRAFDNPVIDAAIDLGNSLGLPVLVYHGVREDYPYASDRLHFFLLGATRDLQSECRKRGLRCVNHVERRDFREKGLVYRLAEDAVAVLTDDQPVFVAREQAARFASKVERAVFAVDSARLVPTRTLDKGISTTPGFRKASGALRGHYEAHASDFAASVPVFGEELCFVDANLAEKTDAEILAIIADCDIDHSLPPSAEFPPTVAAAEKALSTFVDNNLKTYAYRRNNAADEEGVSRLSPYLHFGVLGPRSIAAAVRGSDVPANAKWKYLDELLTWREYFHYLAFHGSAPDQFSTVPDRPRQSLLDHATDARPALYTLSDLVHGRTDDETWNAAQRQWLHTGYMHNNLRMYWGKQIIKWTRDPETAWKTACYINDRLALDGRDPATYGNMKWVFGMSKPSWKEQPVYGWVPPKSDRAIRKREGAIEWLAHWAAKDDLQIAVPDGLPDDIFCKQSEDQLSIHS
jgi:deoxyribodipyrimidine photo-lyase